jgi:hypothetical protein
MPGDNDSRLQLQNLSQRLTETMTKEATPVTGTSQSPCIPSLSAPAPVLCLFKPIAHVCTLKTAEDGLSASSASS